MVTIDKGTVVAHFKRFHFLPSELKAEPNKYLYEIVDLAVDCSHCDKTVVVYRALYGDRMLFVRDIEEFTAYILSERRYRFEPWRGEADG